MIGHPPRSERGVGTLVMVGVMAVVLALSLVAICIAGYLVAAQHARTAADLAALSGASTFAAGGDACSAARKNAGRNGASVTSCNQVGDQIDFVVTVGTSVSVGVRVPGLPWTVNAVAYAGSTSG